VNRRWITYRAQRLPVSLRFDRRVPPVVALSTLAIMTALTINVGYGEYWIPPLDVARTLLGLDAGNTDYAFIINTLRLPRALVALLVGVCLAISGAILQGLTRNPLADPGIVGVEAGASLAAVTLIVALPNVSSFWLPFAAFGGALTVAALIYLLAWNNGDSPIRLILIGIGLASVGGALTTLMITFGEIFQVARALIWLTGSVYGRSWEDLWPLLPWLLICGPGALVLARDLNALNLGEDVARGLGSPVVWRRGLLLLISVALAAVAVATAGTIGFVGLIAPHSARLLVGPQHEGVLPVSALLGGLLVLLADLIGRTLFAPVEIPCGIITAVVGAPFFLYLLYRRRN
jgi:iron complex transport system permease protein